MSSILWRGAVTLLGVFFGLAVAPTGAATSANDPRPMTQVERAAFMRLTCGNMKQGIEPGIYRCLPLIGYPRDVTAPDFRLSTVAYGAFTRVGADQAYATYDTLAEPHMFDFGGGILFDRSGSAWKLVRWYRGGQMDRCVALPGTGIVRMLCLSGYSQEGEVLTMVSVRAVPASARESWDSAVPVQDHAGPNVFRLLISADDTRNMNPVLLKGSQDCGEPSKYQPRVLSIDTLQRSAKTGFFAESKATYVTPKEEYDACKAGAQANVKAEKMTIYYAFRNGEVKVNSPVAIGQATP